MVPRKLTNQQKLDRQEQKDREELFERIMDRCPHPDAVETKAMRNAALRALKKDPA